ncbi:MAG TPA: EamA family transporter, partial [Burkholderiaceae bacterium]|nr:EamA family transporter [Burkholderiaceae bacterium]
APAVQQALRVGLVSSVLAAARSPIVWLGLLTYGLGAVLWLGVLAQMDVGQAYPFVGIGFLLTMVFGIAFLGEAVSPARIAGTALVVVGIALVAGT